VKARKRRTLEAAGWQVGSTEEFLGTSKQKVWKQLGLSIPVDWMLEPMERDPDHALLSTPSPNRYFATIDWRLRGFRMGCTTYGLMAGETWDRKRKKYTGRNWKQAIVDDAIAHLQELLK
jgi:hypothetical protein